MKKLKRFIIVVILLLTVFIIYVEVVNRDSPNMTYRQKIMKAIYPAIMWMGKLTGAKAKKMENTTAVSPTTPVFDLAVQLNNGQQLKLEQLKGKKLLLVNTASHCGYTGQYEQLQKLYEGYKEQLVVIGFPANDFKEQEKGSDEEIAQFCKVNYGVTFPLASKSSVVKGASQNPIFKWLSDKKLNGWNEQEPTWNFSKYLLDEEGKLLHYFDPGVSPLSEEVKNAIEK